MAGVQFIVPLVIIRVMFINRIVLILTYLTLIFSAAWWLFLYNKGLDSQDATPFIVTSVVTLFFGLSGIYCLFKKKGLTRFFAITSYLMTFVILCVLLSLVWGSLLDQLGEQCSGIFGGVVSCRESYQQNILFVLYNPVATLLLSGILAGGLTSQFLKEHRKQRD